MIDINLFEQSQVYMLYDVYKRMEKSLESKENTTEEENEKLISIKKQLELIETYANKKMSETFVCSKEEILLKYGHKPTALIQFHPGSKGYTEFGKEVVGNIQFSEDELIEMLTNIQNKVPRSRGKFSLLRVPQNDLCEVSTNDIYIISGSH